MIAVQEPSGSLLLVNQPDHAHMSAQIASAWRRPDVLSDDTWSRLIVALRRHDDGWHAEEAAATLDTEGRPDSFRSMDTQRHVALWHRSIDLLASDDAYAALLVALHARWLYTEAASDWVQDPQSAQQFVDQMNCRIDALIKQVASGPADHAQAVEPSNLALAQRLFAAFDALSLAMLGGITWIPQTEVVAFGDHRSRLHVRLVDRTESGGRAELAPWPFTSGGLVVATRAVRLHGQRFGDTAELLDRLREAKKIQIEWHLQAG